jgi:hypothetical protein
VVQPPPAPAPAPSSLSAPAPAPSSPSASSALALPAPPAAPGMQLVEARETARVLSRKLADMQQMPLAITDGSGAPPPTGEAEETAPKRARPTRAASVKTVTVRTRRSPRGRPASTLQLPTIPLDDAATPDAPTAQELNTMRAAVRRASHNVEAMREQLAIPGRRPTSATAAKLKLAEDKLVLYQKRLDDARGSSTAGPSAPKPRSRSASRRGRASARHGES